MGHAPVWKLLFRFSGPTILSMVVAAGYTVADAIFIGQLGQEALGALPVVFPPILMVLASARQVIFLIPALLILPRLCGVVGLWIAFPVADLLSILLTLI